MATEKKITSRIQQKHDVAANWAKATNFIPKKGEIIIYDAEYNASGEETQAVRFKIGDGSKTVNNLPFAVIDYSSDIETLEQKVANNSTAIGALQENTVPKTRKINNKALSSDITLGAADVGVNETTFPGLKKTGTVTGVKMNGTTKNPSSGVVDLGTVITAHQSLDGKQDKITSSNKLSASLVSGLSTVATSGSYDDLLHKPSFVSSVNGSSGAITNVAKTDETNVFTNSQIIQRPSDETQASLWNYSGCIGYSHWVQGSSSEPRIGIGYKNSGIRVFNGTTETPMQYYDVTMPSQAGQLVTDTFAKFTGETSGIGHPYRVFQDEAAYATYQSGDPSSAKYTSQTNAALIVNTDTNNRTVFTDGRIDNKKNGTKYELTLPTNTGTLALTSQIPTVNNGTLTIQKNGTKVQTFTANQSSSVTANITVPTKASDVNALSLDGGTINKSKTIKMDASANSNGANLKWGTVNHKNPYIGYASDQADGTFVVGSLLGTNYASGLAIGGGSGNLLWKGTKVATTSDIPTVNNGTLTIQKNGTTVATFSANQSGNATANITVPTFSLSGTTLTITM